MTNESEEFLKKLQKLGYEFEKIDWEELKELPTPKDTFYLYLKLRAELDQLEGQVEERNGRNQ